MIFLCIPVITVRNVLIMEIIPDSNAAVMNVTTTYTASQTGRNVWINLIANNTAPLISV